MAHARFFDEEIRAKMPLCSYRKYTLSEIMNATIRKGFTVLQFDEHPSWANPNLPGELLLLAKKYKNKRDRKELENFDYIKRIRC